MPEASQSVSAGGPHRPDHRGDHPRSRRDRARTAQYAGILRGVVADAFRIPPEELAAPTRGALRTARIRQIGMYLGHVALSMSLTDAGRAFRRDRTTAAYACRVVEMARDNARFDRHMAGLEARLQAAALGVRS